MINNYSSDIKHRFYSSMRHLRIGRNSKILLCVSGGQDSMFLLAMMLEWRARFCITGNIYVITFDHGLRTDSAHEANMVKSIADKNGCITEIVKLNVPKSGNRSDKARNARYDAIDGFCIKNSVLFVFMGHQLDDQLENMHIRGNRIPNMHITSYRKHYKLMRPLLNIDRYAIRNAMRNTPYIKDPTNQDPRNLRACIRKYISSLDCVGRMELIKKLNVGRANMKSINGFKMHAIKKVDVTIDFALKFHIDILDYSIDFLQQMLYYFIPWVLGSQADRSYIYNLITHIKQSRSIKFNSRFYYGRCAWVVFKHHIVIHPYYFAINPYNRIILTSSSFDGLGSEYCIKAISTEGKPPRQYLNTNYDLPGSNYIDVSSTAYCSSISSDKICRKDACNSFLYPTLYLIDRKAEYRVFDMNSWLECLHAFSVYCDSDYLINGSVL